VSHKYLEIVRERNKARMNYCYLCGENAKGIIALGHVIKPVCQRHLAIAEITEFEREAVKKARETGEVPF